MKKTLLMTVLMIAAIVFGGLISGACEGSAALGWLAYSKSFNFSPGEIIAIDVITLNFGISISANVAQLILILVGFFAYCKIAPKLIK
ncbi:MAG: DUF4321 domain-containing protein [Ruminococcus sp.]|nr:DUF4321 domain-containing protein [Ruminococcus sp.]